MMVASQVIAGVVIGGLAGVVHRLLLRRRVAALLRGAAQGPDLGLRALLRGMPARVLLPAVALTMTARLGVVALGVALVACTVAGRRVRAPAEGEP